MYYNFRYYSPELGRWLSRDPIEEKGGYNLYGMVNNNPVDYWDWLGLNGFGYDGSDSDKQFDNGGQTPTDFNRRPSTEGTQCSNQVDYERLSNELWDLFLAGLEGADNFDHSGAMLFMIIPKLEKKVNNDVKSPFLELDQTLLISLVVLLTLR